jgi:probable F420-dependent oxidoreductase
VTGQVRVGVQLPEVERIVRWPEYVAMARAAERVGFDSVWVGDHLLYRGDGGSERGPWEAWTILAAIAAATERVELGPLVACAGFHAPAMLAKQAATVDEISGGRLVLALGAGWNEPEFRAFGFPFDRRASRFEESFEVIRRLMSGERVTMRGHYVEVDDAVLLPPPARRPRLMIGSTGRRVLTAALPHVDAWNTWFDWYGNSPEGFAARSAEIDEIASSVGRDPGDIERSACLLVALDPRTGERRVDPAAPPVAGTPTRVAEAIRAMGDAGADEVILVLDPITQGSIEAVGEALGRWRRP